MKKLNYLIKVNKIQYLLGIGVYFNIFLPFIKNIKTIACEHSSYDIVSLKVNIVRKLVYRHVNKIVSLTQEDADKYLNINRETYIIPNPLPIIEKIQIQRENIVVAVGRLTELKGFKRLLKIWKLLDEKTYILKIYGDGEQREELEKLKKDLGLKNVKFMGNTQKISEKLFEAKIFVMTSYKEGFPMVLLEAMNCGLPCIAYDIKTGPKEIISEGNDGFLIKDNNEIDFVEKLNFLIKNENERRRMSVNAEKNVERYKQSEIIKKWIEIFKD